WKDSSYPAYVLLQKHSSLAKLQEKIAGTMEKHSPGSDALVQLQPLTRVHLYEFSGGGPIVYIYIFISIGILIMVIAGINFINLTTARSLNRAKEVGLRKVIGSSRRQLVNQFMGESILFASGALVLAIAIVLAILPAVNHSLNKNLQLRPTTEQVLVFLAIAFGLGIFSGLYPALFLSRISASDAMRGSFAFGLTRGTLRKLLVIAQFTVSVFFIFASFVAIRQLSFMKNKDLGFKKDHVISLQMRGGFAQNAQAIKSRLLENPNIHSITAFNGSFTGESNGTSISDWEGRHGQAALGVAIQAVDENFTRTFNVPVAQGRFFAANRTADAKESVVINQAAAMSLGMKDPVGKWLQVQVGQQSGVRKIIGVLKDYHLTTLRRKITPLVMVMAPWWYRQVFIRIAPRDIGTTLTFIQKSIKKIAPDVPWEYAFLDETIDRLYQGEKQMTEIMTFGTLIALTITALGLFGLIVFTVGQRTKEIGVRKVMGASATDILKMLSLDVLKWIIMACVLAWPLAFYAMNKWLGNFAYRVRIGSGAFLFSVFMLVGLALATMSFQAIRAARANPVESLRYE
ncbi:MAG: FtsX-like permease family protein, partial [Candidatus Aminicenantes bacterium]|nr:FtsX-like permease family protein [Candidatus Aminicenantes bacterium]